jgi:lipid II:glycine glycyltransferase (peptidoglycan interpeptide bridge formation enzyme)
MNFIHNIKETNLEACDNAGSFLQSSMWGEFKSRFEWKAKAFLVGWEGDEETPLLVIYRPLAAGVSFAYVPWGPQLPAGFLDGDRVQALMELSKKIKPLLPPNIAFLRYDPPWHNEIIGIINAEAVLFKLAGFKHAAADIQPPDTVIVDLSPPCEKILADMKSKCRYNITLAGKKGVKVTVCGSRELDVFYGLFKETAERDGIAFHSFDYYKTLFETCDKRAKSLKINLYIASHEEDRLAAIIVLVRGKTATYLYGASSNIKRNLMAPYALQWKAMQDAKDAGCTEYDLFGIPPDDNPDHPMAGLYRFKTGFGGKIIHRAGSWDYKYKPLIYNLFTAAEALRKKLRDRRKKISHKDAKAQS